MKVIGLLIYYDESPSWLGATVASLSKCCDHVCAIDGAYLFYPQGQPHSGPDLAAEVVSTALSLGMGVTYHAPQEVWAGNEIGKRNFMLELGMTVAEPGRDWFVVVDADEVVSHVPSNFREQLAETDANVASYQLITREDWHETPQKEQAARGVSMPPGITPIRAIFRALPSLRVHEAHHAYAREQNGKRLYLWSRDAAEEAIETDLKVEHRRAYRTKYRLEQAEAYYRRRDELGLESEPLAEQPSDGQALVVAPLDRA